MRARLIHRFEYRYTKPVQLGPHRFCLRPRPQAEAVRTELHGLGVAVFEPVDQAGAHARS